MRQKHELHKDFFETFAFFANFFHILKLCHYVFKQVHLMAKANFFTVMRMMMMKRLRAERSHASNARHWLNEKMLHSISVRFKVC